MSSLLRYRPRLGIIQHAVFQKAYCPLDVMVAGLKMGPVTRLTEEVRETF